MHTCKALTHQEAPQPESLTVHSACNTPSKLKTSKALPAQRSSSVLLSLLHHAASAFGFGGPAGAAAGAAGSISNGSFGLDTRAFVPGCAAACTSAALCVGAARMP